MELASWFQEKGASVPTRSDARPKTLNLKASDLVLPDHLDTSKIRGASSARSPGSGAIWIESVILTARREEYRALGLVFIAYAMSPQNKEFRLRLSNHADEIAEIVIWPSEQSELESALQYKSRILEVRYAPHLADGNPNYTTTEQDKTEEEYPREHLPYCRTGSLDVEAGGVVRRGEPVAAHFKGTAPSLIWMGKFFLNLALEDSNATLAYLYNTNPAESLRWMSAELRLTIADPSAGPKMYGDD
jgi:hypothetical protein